jgi:hypothetical protein
MTHPSHIQNWISVQSTWALMCLGVWSNMGYIEDRDVKAVTALPDIVDGQEEGKPDENWDMIF